MLDPVTYIKLLSGFALLFLGGEALVRGSVTLARRLQVSPLLIGATVVAFGTSAPELVVTLGAALKGSYGIAYGNVIGSNIANLLLILGMAAAITPIVVARGAVMRDAMLLLGASVLLVVFASFGTIVAWQGILMLLLLCVATCFSYWHERRRGDAAAALHQHEADELQALPQPPWLAILFVVVGVTAVAGGAHLLVDSATILARAIGISETVIGLTVVAVGTSLPELATTVVAAYRKHADVALGNVLGSSVFNILAIMGVVSVVTPLPVPEEVMSFDIWVLLGITAGVIALTLSGLRMARPVGAVFLAGYAAFIAVQYLGV
jgi:cation:H+ antiporter